MSVAGPAGGASATTNAATAAPVLSERKKRTTEALWYNGLVQSWTEAVRLAADTPAARPVQGELFGEG